MLPGINLNTLAGIPLISASSSRKHIQILEAEIKKDTP